LARALPDAAGMPLRVWSIAGAIALTLLAGCARDGSSSAHGTGGSGGAVGADGAVCPSGSHAEDGGCVSTLVGWKNGPPLGQKRDLHVTFTATTKAGSFLYVLGGVVNATSVIPGGERIPIRTDGTLGAWETSSGLPEPVSGHGVAVVRGTVIVTGGMRAGSSGEGAPSVRTDLARIGTDGKLKEFEPGPALAVGRFHGASLAIGDDIYVIGGLTGLVPDSTSLVERSKLKSDGTLDLWKLATPLPAKRSHHASVASNGSIYVLGGVSGDPAGVHTPLADVIRAPVLEDGSIGEWTKAGELPVTLAAHSALAFLGQIYVFGGLENDTLQTGHVRRAEVRQDGTLGEWEELPSLPKGRSHVLQTPLFDGFIYSVGGEVDQSSIADVLVGEMT
jgi:Kelch motif